MPPWFAWLALLLPMIASGCGPAPFKPDAAQDNGVTVHMGGSLTSVVGISKSTH